MWRWGGTLLLSALLVSAMGGAGSAQQVRSERLAGGNENPPVISDGSGTFRARLLSDRAAFRLRYDIPSSEILQAHLHIANPGQNGLIVVFLCTNLGNTPGGATPRGCPDSPGEVTGDIVAGDVQPIADIIDAGDLDGLLILARQGSLYVNVHTGDHTGGEIRGQVSPRRR